MAFSVHMNGPSSDHVRIERHFNSSTFSAWAYESLLHRKLLQDMYLLKCDFQQPDLMANNYKESQRVERKVKRQKLTAVNYILGMS